MLGGLGAVLRFQLDGFVQRRLAGEFPFGTLVVNVVGAFLLGLLVGAGLGGNAFLLAGTGLIGAFTTFSTWMLETERLGEDGDDRFALANVLIPVAVGLIAAVAGWGVGAVL